MTVQRTERFWECGDECDAVSMRLTYNLLRLDFVYPLTQCFFTATY